MFKIEKINNIKVKPVSTKNINNEKIKGYDLFPEIYANIFICAKKKSGKTSVINTILKDCADKNTRVIVFCATHNADNSYIEIKKMLDKKNINSIFFDSIIDENKVDNLHVVIDELTKEAEKLNNVNDDEDNEHKNHDIINIDHEGNIKVKIKKPKKLAPNIIFIFDDISDELKNRFVPKLLKTNRHFKSKVIVSTQYPLDIHPGSRKQFDYIILFQGHDDAKLEIIYNNACLSIDFETFKKIYHYATQDKYNFLYIDCTDYTYRKNFDEKIVLDKK